jgi:hypothetical protein
MVPCFYQTIVTHAANAVVIKVKTYPHEHILCVEAIIGKKLEERFNLGSAFRFPDPRRK